MLQPPDIHHLSAAIGWLELGNPAEAKADLARVSVQNQNHPDVIEARWLIAAEQEDWQEGLRVARSLLEVAPERPSGWLHQAYALRRIPNGGLPQAREALVSVFERFPNEPTIPYNLSCYDCQLGNLKLARTWLKRAMKVGGAETIKRMALNDPDLEPLWEEIRKL